MKRAIPWESAAAGEREQETEGGYGVEITLTIPEELALRLQPLTKELPQILELGVRAWIARDVRHRSFLPALVNLRVALLSRGGTDVVR